MPYNTTAVIDADDEVTEPEEGLRGELPDERRLVTVYPDGESRIEEDYDWDGWVQVAEITTEPGLIDECEYLGDQLGEGWRVVTDWNAGAYIEKFVEVED